MGWSATVTMASSTSFIVTFRRGRLNFTITAAKSNCSGVAASGRPVAGSSLPVRATGRKLGLIRKFTPVLSGSRFTDSSLRKLEHLRQGQAVKSDFRQDDLLQLGLQVQLRAPVGLALPSRAARPAHTAC